MKEFTVKVVAIIKNIPEGKVMTYGQIARLADHPRGARQVARILHSMSRKHRLPWHRVINAQGKISIKDDELEEVQRLSLEGEGVRFINDSMRIDLGLYQHRQETRESWSRKS